jgi:hypothetical protein
MSTTEERKSRPLTNDEKKYIKHEVSEFIKNGCRSELDVLSDEFLDNEKMSTLPKWISVMSFLTGLYALSFYSLEMSYERIWILLNTIFVGIFLIPMPINSESPFGTILLLYSFISQFCFVLTIPIIYMNGVNELFWPFTLLVGIKLFVLSNAFYSLFSTFLNFQNMVNKMKST